MAKKQDVETPPGKRVSSEFLDVPVTGACCISALQGFLGQRKRCAGFLGFKKRERKAPPLNITQQKHYRDKLE